MTDKRDGIIKEAVEMLAQYWDNIRGIPRVTAYVGFDAGYSAHVPETGVIYK